ncbi:MAG: cell division protein ZapA [Tannerella sp.]|nr:cell division protein ZapA [Tannerella sp.]
MNENEFDIKLEVAEKSYYIPVKRGDEEEEFLYREAAKRVGQHLFQYRQYFSKSLENTQLLTMVAIHLARDVLRLEAENEVKTYARKIQQWTDKLDEYLKK